MSMLMRSWMLRSVSAHTCGRIPGYAAEHRSRGQAGPAGVIEIEQPADQFSRRVQAADRPVVGVENFGFRGDAQSAEGESQAAGHRVAFERRRIDGVCPIALVDGEADGRSAVLDVRIECNVGSHRLVVFGDGIEELPRVHAFKLSRELIDGVGHDLGDLLDPVLVALQVLHLLIEDLPSELAGLLQNHAAVFGISVIAEISAFIDEALAVGIDENGERIGMFLELVADGKVAEFGRVHLPLHRMAAGPVAAWTGTDLHRHTDAVAVVEARAPHFGEIPAGPEIARAPFGVGFESAAGEHNRLADQIAFHVIMPDTHAPHAYAVEKQLERACLVSDLDSALAYGFGEHLDEARAAADGFHGEAAPEFELAFDF